MDLAQVNLKDHYAFSRFESLGQVVQMLVYPAFMVAAVLVIFYFLIGAFKYIISQGDKGQVANAKKMITSAIIGFVLLILVFIIMSYLAERFLGIPNIIGG